jgi:hypothetical protein
MKTQTTQTTQDTIKAALTAKFTPEQGKTQAVKRFYEMRGLYNRGRIGGSMLANALKLTHVCLNG